ncbi:phosphotransferase family protein [Novosphingobium rosa]|uniref:phosphotransferase family protein n=1 Tax=Novosphingobium rosa TaxID=76978 RepID=UPI000832FDAF|nr:phosphotransferase family protein [Novosphingobium rosa]
MDKRERRKQVDRCIDDISRKVLISVHDFLERLTKAGNLSTEQVTEAFMAATALGYQIARMTYPEALRDEVNQAGEALARKIGPHTPHPRSFAQAWSSEPGAALCGAIESHDISNDPTARAAVFDFLVRQHEPMDPLVSHGTRSTYTGGRGDASTQQDATARRDFTAAFLDGWLQNSSHAPAGTKVSGFRRLMGGYSKATYIVTLDQAGTETTVVIRKDSPGLPTGSSVASEFPVLGEMQKIGVPVPAPLWLEADEAVCDGAFMGVSFAEGTPANQIVPTDPATALAWAHSCAEVIGTLHAKTAIPGGDVREPIAHEIDALEARMRTRERAPHPGLLIGLAWLRAHLDDLRDRPACRIHGDFGFHNMMMRDGRIVAMLDWEFSRIGDPVEDLASIKPFMDQIGAWDAFYERYQALSGFTLDATADRYFSVWQEARNMVACLGSLNSLLLPGVKDVPLTVAGTIYIPKYEISILNAISQAETHHG